MGQVKPAEYADVGRHTVAPSTRFKSGGVSTAVEALLASGVSTVHANDGAFSAIKTGGSGVAWGNEASVCI
jgi:hypothetical protein